MEFEGELNPDVLIACTLQVSGAEPETFSNTDSNSFPSAVVLFELVSSVMTVPVESVQLT